MERERRRQHLMLMKALEARKKVKKLPELSRLPGLLLPGGAFSNCLMVMQFLHSFGRVLGLAPEQLPSLSLLQEGLLSAGRRSVDYLHTLLVSLLAAAVHDPGLPPGRRVRPPMHMHYRTHAL
ncbi:hypothetical protein CRUP_023355 [Coryphaenoides rupestris]|nr:hypothetical protein CRUP_023355 [Coryphaenoides rupestris]